VAPRAYWKGYLKLSLVSCPIALYPATSEREKISFHQINKKTGNREDALKDLIRKKQGGEKIEAPAERAPAKVINLMDALRRSVEAEGGGGRKPVRAASAGGAPKKAGRSSARQKKAG